MSLYLNEHERSATPSIDRDELRKLIDEAVWSCRSSALHELRLANCGPYGAQRLRRFERDLDSFGEVKQAQKQNDARERANDAGADLVRAVREMQARITARWSDTAKAAGARFAAIIRMASALEHGDLKRALAL